MKSRGLQTLLVAGVVIAGCGVPSQQEPSAIDRDALPADLARVPPSRSGRGPGTVVVYLVGDEGLVAVQRPVRQPLSLDRALAQLAQGARANEADAGLRTLLPPELELRGSISARGTARIELDSGFLDAASSGQVLALAQIVFTVTELPGVRRVQFLLDQEPVGVPREDGTFTTRPVTRLDYDSAG